MTLGKPPHVLCMCVHMWGAVWLSCSSCCLFKIDWVKGAHPLRLVSLHFPFSLSFVLATSLFLSCVFQVTVTWWLTAFHSDSVHQGLICGFVAEKWAEQIHGTVLLLFQRCCIILLVLFISLWSLTVWLLRLCPDWWLRPLRHVRWSQCVPALPEDIIVHIHTVGVMDQNYFLFVQWAEILFLTRSRQITQIFFPNVLKFT